MKILSGVEHGWTLGTPVALFVENLDQRPGDYSEMADIPRPSHADFTYQVGTCGGETIDNNDIGHCRS